MSFRMFHEMCPEIGARETRSFALAANSCYGLPADEDSHTGGKAAGCPTRWPHPAAGPVPRLHP